MLLVHNILKKTNKVWCLIRHIKTTVRRNNMQFLSELSFFNSMTLKSSAIHVRRQLYPVENIGAFTTSCTNEYLFRIHRTVFVWVVFLTCDDCCCRWHRLHLPVAVLPDPGDSRRTGRGRMGAGSPGAPPGRQLRADRHRPRHGVRPGRRTGGRGLQLDHHYLGLGPTRPFDGSLGDDSSGSLASWQLGYLLLRNHLNPEELNYERVAEM